MNDLILLSMFFSFDFYKQFLPKAFWWLYTQVPIHPSNSFMVVKHPSPGQVLQSTLKIKMAKKPRNQDGRDAPGFGKIAKHSPPPIKMAGKAFKQANGRAALQKS